jgi:hypothetical protein
MTERFVSTDIQQSLPNSAMNSVTVSPFFSERPAEEGEMSILPHKLYTLGEPLVTWHNYAKEEEMQETRAFLLGYAKPKDIDRILTPDGRLKFVSDVDPYSLYDRQINKVLGRELNSLYKLVQQSYLKGHGGDFNNHLVGHVNTVADKAVFILETSDPEVTEETCDDTRISGMLHDTGGILGRPDHAHVGLLLSRDIFPKLLANKRRFAAIGQGIAQHDEQYYRKLKGYGGQPFAQRSKLLQVTQSPLSAAIVIADKSDIGRERVHNKARTRYAMERHNHSEVNMFMGDLGFSITDDAINWTLAFNPYIYKKERSRNADLVIGKVDNERFLAYGSKRIRNNPDDPFEGINFEKLWQEMCFIYGPQKPGAVNRLELMVDTAITWFRPNFNIHYYNPYNKNESMYYSYNAENIDEQFAQMAEVNADIKAKTP